MNIRVKSVEEIGELVRLTRKTQGLRQDDLGAMAGCSHKFIVDVEKGKTTVQTGLLLALMEELGIEISISLPDNISEAFTETFCSSNAKMTEERRQLWQSRIES